MSILDRISQIADSVSNEWDRCGIGNEINEFQSDATRTVQSLRRDMADAYDQLRVLAGPNPSPEPPATSSQPPHSEPSIGQQAQQEEPGFRQRIQPTVSEETPPSESETGSIYPSFPGSNNFDAGDRYVERVERNVENRVGRLLRRFGYNPNRVTGDIQLSLEINPRTGRVTRISQNTPPFSYETRDGEVRDIPDWLMGHVSREARRSVPRFYPMEDMPSGDHLIVECWIPMGRPNSDEFLFQNR